MGGGAAPKTARAIGPEPLWAYGYTRPAQPGEHARMPAGPTRRIGPKEDAAELNRLREIPGSAGRYSVLQIRYGADVVDWSPDEHPPLTPIMKHGPVASGDQALGCAFCHMPNGKGRPENAPVAGQSVGYLLAQMRDFRADQRKSADPRKANSLLMVALAKAMSDQEIDQAAHYFAAVKWSPWIRVVETDLVPTTRIHSSGMFLATSSTRTEPIAGRIIEVPEDTEATELLRNPHSGFVAYVPVGSVKRGEQIATGRGAAISCVTCHGPDLNGVGDVPAIAGRSPSYLARQLYDFQAGTRRGPAAVLMQPVVASLTEEELTALVAYVASLPPPTK